VLQVLFTQPLYVHEPVDPVLFAAWSVHVTGGNQQPGILGPSRSVAAHPEDVGGAPSQHTLDQVQLGSLLYAARYSS